ncbi:MAG: hypothetical protein HYR63_06760 [Proteobacteria bacterium]|nr:hypothetical protein [Pseudomonadota bacterium]
MISAPATSLASAAEPRISVLIIDPEGCVQDLVTALRRVAGSGTASVSVDSTGFLCRNRGHIQIETGLAVTACRLRPLMTTARALASARDILLRVDRPVALHVWIKGWMPESYPNGMAAAARLEALQTFTVPGERPHEAFLTARQPLEKLFDDDAHRFKPLLLRWRIAGRRLEPNMMSWLAKYGLSDRMTIAEVTRERPFGVIRYLGPGITVFGADFPFRAVGTPVEELPIRDYGGWAGQSYARVAASGTPHAEHVDALLKEPSGMTRRSRYERLLIPFNDPKGRSLVMTLSQMNPDIAIPLYA